MYSEKRRGRPANWGRPQNSAGRLTTTALCVGGYDDHNNVANGGTDQNTDGAIFIVVRVYARNCSRAAAISLACGERGYEQAHWG